MADVYKQLVKRLNDFFQGFSLHKYLPMVKERGII